MEVFAPNDIARNILMEAIEHLADWPLKTAEQFRNVAIGANDTLFAINPLLTITVDSDVAFLRNMIRSTASEGRIIDFGFIPNEILKQEANRARDLFETNELQHPFDRWLGLTAWEGGYCGYHISPNPSFPDEILVLEIYGIAVPNAGDMLLVYDIVSIKINGYKKTIISPLNMHVSEMNAPDALERRAANSLDPTVTMLRLLADASIPVVYRPAPEKLNKRRAQQGKPLIPAHHIVETRDYVATLSAHATEHTRHGGHHSSPIAHWRRAHKRALASGRVVPVRSSKVNWRDTEELHRLFYRTKQ
jgi:hypothetical protein